jgi:glycosyltransferase involved in cell wall biosynthesis
MRILVAHLVGAARSGGMSRLMGRAHDELERNGHEVEYLTADDVSPAVRGRAGRFVFPFLVRRAAVAAARRGRPFDIVNVHEPHGAVVARVRADVGNAAVVAMTHGVERRGWDIALQHGPSRPSTKSRIVYPLTSLWASRLTLRHADHVICLNTQDRDFLHQRFGIDPARITRITPGADPAFGSAAAGRTYESARRLLFAGTWLPRKGTHELAAAFTSLVERGIDLQLDVLGAGVPDRDVLRLFSPAAAARVSIVGSGDESLMARAMAASDLFVLPSLFEGTPLTLVEAMWSGLPIVTTRTAGMQDVITHERTGLLVPPADAVALAEAIARLVGDWQLRRSLGALSHNIASSLYTWQKTAATFAAAYDTARARHVPTAR